ncbi:MAG TPA: cobalamin-dependent protein, partial [Polyangiales bacterium]
MRQRSVDVDGAVSVPARIVTAASLFDGHDAAIHIVRRILQALGAEVIHLGHDRSVDEIVQAAIQEDAQAIAVSSYQGGHMEFFRYLVDQLRARGAGEVRVFGGGGGTISERERNELERYGVARIFSPEDGRALGLQGMVGQLLHELEPARLPPPSAAVAKLSTDADRTIAQLITWFELRASRDDDEANALRAQLQQRMAAGRTRVIGITGTGGAGKSSVVDELLLRLRRAAPSLSIGLLLVDPTRRKKGGALLGDRIRLNAIGPANVYVRSLA